MKGTTRAFLAVDVTGEGVLDALQGVQGEFAKLGIRMKLVERENIHITVKFLGEVDDALLPRIHAALQERVNGVPPLDEGFEVEVSGVGQFSYRVLWAGIKGDGGKFTGIFQEIEDFLEEFGFAREKRKFRPHVTLARLKFVPRDRKDDWMSLVRQYRNEAFGNMVVRRVELKKSTLTPRGPIYTNLRYLRY
ncbi:MAG: RNA 2',3'-cyclic phosphodiesterase [Promethearchaeota archaeon]